MALYTTYIPLIILANWVIICYRSHLLWEAGNSIDEASEYTTGTQCREGLVEMIFLCKKTWVIFKVPYQSYVFLVSDIIWLSVLQI